MAIALNNLDRTPLRWRHYVAENPASAPPQSLRGHFGEHDTLSKRTALFLGLGAVGGPCFLDAARLGVGTIIGVDPDSYGAESWTTQPATPGEAGKSKAWVLAEKAHAINPNVNVHTAIGLAQDLPLRVLHQADVFVAAGDNLELLVWASRMGQALGKRLDQGAVHGESWTCFLRGWDLRESEAPCPACNLSAREWTQLASRYGCDPATMQAQGREPTRTLPNLCGTAAHMLTGELLKVLCGQDAQTLRGEELAYCQLSQRMWRTSFNRSRGCRCPHERWKIVERDEPLAAITLNELLGSNATCSVRSEQPWFEIGMCGKCGKDRVVRRFARPGSTLWHCHCGGALIASPIGMSSQIPASTLDELRDMPLSQLGLAPGEALGISEGDEWTYFLLGQPEELP